MYLYTEKNIVNIVSDRHNLFTVQETKISVDTSKVLIMCTKTKLLSQTCWLSKTIHLICVPIITKNSTQHRLFVLV